ncbi:MAG: hypothetical protein ACHREM_12225 [Polyangiales bacterium]
MPHPWFRDFRAQRPHPAYRDAFWRGMGIGADPTPAADKDAMTLDQAIALTPHWGDGDFATLDRLCKEIGCKAEDLLLVMTSESRIDPKTANRDSSGWPLAVGLNQLTRVAAEQMGLIKPGDKQAWLKLAEAYVKKPIAEQLPTVIAYYKATPWGAMGNKYESAAKLYQANAAPSTMFAGDGNATVLYPFGSDSFEKNKPLWILRKPTGIVFGDLKAATDWHRKNPLYQAAVTRLKNVRQQSGPW